MRSAKINVVAVLAALAASLLAGVATPVRAAEDTGISNAPAAHAAPKASAPAKKAPQKPAKKPAKKVAKKSAAPIQTHAAPSAAAAASPPPLAAAPAPMANVTVTAAPPPLTARDKDIFAQAIKAAAKHNWPKARSTIATAHNALLSKIIDWAYLREPGPHASFSERVAFLVANPKWPSANDIRRRAEESIDDSVSATTLVEWFTANPPISTAGKAAYARALNIQGNVAQAHDIARDAWINGSFGKDDERAFLREFNAILTPEDHWARIDRILYEEQTTAAERLLQYVDPGRAQVARARIALIKTERNAEATVATVPAALQNDPGLLYDHVKWRRARDNTDGARQLVPPYEIGGARPDLWWRERNALARDALAEGNVTDAYSLAKHHGSVDPLSVSEAEWLAGWISLRFLKDGETALAHFEKVYDSVQTPPSLARGAYWTGRTTEYLGRPDLAAEWYQRAATYVTTYYGQLALARLKGDNVPQLPQDPEPTTEERAAYNATELTRALRALMDVDAKPYQRAFAQALAENSSSALDREMTAELVSHLARVDLGVIVARQASRDKITLVQYGWPAPAYSYPTAPEKAFILSIARQESNFDAGATSGVGARGLMQLMPPTAKALSRATKQPYAEKRLTTDAAYNLRLGSVYLNNLLETFNGSYVLAAAAYNAGPGRARQWIKQFGDPRDPGVDAIDWVEQIPFAETRTYVQRIMENLMVYRAVLDRTPQVPRTLETDLARHG